MKKFLIEWETDFCDNFPERMGDHIIEAETEEEAVKKFNALKIQKACVSRVEEVKNNL